MKKTASKNKTFNHIFSKIRVKFFLLIILIIILFAVFFINSHFDRIEVKTFIVHHKIWKVIKYKGSILFNPMDIDKSALLIEEDSNDYNEYITYDSKVQNNLNILSKTNNVVLDTLYELGVDTMFEHPYDSNLVITCESTKNQNLYWGAREIKTGNLIKLYFFCPNDWSKRKEFVLDIQKDKLKLLQNSLDVSDKYSVDEDLNNISPSHLELILLRYK